MHLGIISPPVPGHLHPFGALGRELIERGHRVTLVHMADLEERARGEGVDFIAIGERDHPRGSLAESLAQLSRLDGLAALRFTIAAIRKTTEMMLRDGPQAIEAARMDALLVDQTEPAGGTIAEHLGIPFVTVCNALALNREPDVPPPFTGWDYRPGLLSRLRNAGAYSVFDRLLNPVNAVVRAYRKQWKLAPHSDPESSFSPLAQISQQPAAFDFPRRRLPETFHYTGPLRKAPPKRIDFPWDRLDGRPLVYASLGTLQNRKAEVFRMFAEACRDLPVQLVIAHGGGLPADIALPGNPLLSEYAPQLDVLARARLTLTHAGLNTVLDSLTHGVPLVAIPITYEQPAIASRIRWSGAGEVLPFSKLSVARLRRTVERVLGEPSYLRGAALVKESIARSGGVERAATLIETAFEGGGAVTASGL